jgi:hypothetical protein
MRHEKRKNVPIVRPAPQDLELGLFTSVVSLFLFLQTPRIVHHLVVFITIDIASLNPFFRIYTGAKYFLHKPLQTLISTFFLRVLKVKRKIFELVFTTLIVVY